MTTSSRVTPSYAAEGAPSALAYAPLALARGAAWPNRLALAPLTNWQSHADGTLADAEYAWLMRRAEGGFGLTMTCAAFVHPSGQGFPGQLGIADARHDAGLRRLAEGLGAAGTISSVQLQHSGARAPQQLTGRSPMNPSADPETGAVAMTEADIEAMIEWFIAAALRADAAGFDGVELHAAHGYLLCAFLSRTLNQRDDAWGGSRDNRARALMRIIAGIRARCRPGFQLGVRLSPERWGIDIDDIVALAGELLADDAVDYVDMSLWNVFKRPHGRESGPSLLEIFAALPRASARLGVTGKIRTPAQIQQALAAGVDFVMLGRAAIVDGDYPRALQADAAFRPTPMPAPAAHLAAQAVSPPFLRYLATHFPDTVDAASLPAES